MNNTKEKIAAILKCSSFAALSLATLAVLYASTTKTANSTKEKVAKSGLMLAAAIATSVSSAALNNSIEEAKDEFI